MYIKIRKLGSLPGEGDTIVSISKMSTIQELRKIIEDKMDLIPSNQMLLYKGKQLIDDHKIMDYDIQLNDVIQLIIKLPKHDVEEHSVQKDIDKSKESSTKQELLDAKSKYFEVGDPVDVWLSDNGAWYEAEVIRICKHMQENDHDRSDEMNLMFRVRSAEHVVMFQTEAKYDEIRPRSYYRYKTSELKKGMVVLANYNIEEPKSRGFWYDVEIKEVSRTCVKGTLLVGKDKAPIENCVLKFVDEIMRIEDTQLLSDKNDNRDDVINIQRKYPYNCEKCKDVKGRKCRECGCRICAGKESCDTMILCDECDYGYHTACLTPPLESVPTDDEWYCPSCKTDDSEIVKAGEKLKVSQKKAKMASNKGESSRDWGRGMACVGRTKECTIVPKDHCGPVPGVEVGTCWKFRLQIKTVEWGAIISSLSYGNKPKYKKDLYAGVVSIFPKPKE